MIAIFGSAGFAKEVHLILMKLYSTDVKIECFVCADDDFSQGQMIRNIPIQSETYFFNRYKNSRFDIYIGIGSPKIKKNIVQKIINNNIETNFPSLIDPSVAFDKKNKFIDIGQGVIICAGVSMTIDIVIEDFSHINLNSTIGHDVFIGKFSTISPGVNISGKVKIGDMSFLGTGATILENLQITSKTVVGAGSVVIRDILESGTYVGIPAKKINH